MRYTAHNLYLTVDPITNKSNPDARTTSIYLLTS